MPSAPQNRLSANGRSLETHSTESPRAAACSLNLRTLAAQTGVSTDGNMLSSNGFPRNCALNTVPRSVPVRVNLGAGADSRKLADGVDGVTAKGYLSHAQQSRTRAIHQSRRSGGAARPVSRAGSGAGAATGNRPSTG